MTFKIPTLEEILNRTLTDLGGFSDGTVPEKSPEFALSRAASGISRGQYGFLSWVLQQAYPSTADDVYGWRHGSTFGITQQSAVFAEMTVKFTGSVGGTIPTDTKIQSKTGVVFNIDPGGSLPSATNPAVSLRAVAVEPGKAGTMRIGDVLELVSPLEGVNTQCTVTIVQVEGQDVEEWLPSGFSRLQYRLRNPPGGGAPGDWIRWAKEVAGVTRAWEFPTLHGANRVAIAFVRDNDINGGIVPESPERSAVLNYISSVAPATTKVEILTNSLLSINFTITGIKAPDVREAVQDALREVIIREGDAALSSIDPRKGIRSTTIPLRVFNDAIASTPGVTTFTIQSPTLPITVTPTTVPALGSCTFV